jgi:hypothetical protein
MHPELLYNFEDLSLFVNNTILGYCLEAITDCDFALLDFSNKHLAEVLIALSLVYQHFKFPFWVAIWMRY